MMRHVLIALCVLLLPAGVLADGERGSAREAQAMVERAVALYDAEGLLAFREYSQASAPEFQDRDLYVFVIDRAGTMAAHALFPEAVGQNALNARDPQGKYYVREMLERASETGVWIDYVFNDPILGFPSPKSAWVVFHDGFLFACGIYAGELGV
ncbi:MAG: cache domain-containing protein [Alphaproteobacteria bacterium]|jgi:cytochrome c